jgi:hypothetical protein
MSFAQRKPAVGVVLNLSQFRTALQAGGFRSVTVTASGGQFFVVARPRAGEHVMLATTHGKNPRGFRDAGKAIAILHAIGAHKIEVDTSKWVPEQAAQEGRRRPDTAERQRRAHEAAMHDAWFRSEVEQALREADDSNAEWISDDDAKASWAVQRAELQARIGRKAG